MSNAATLQPEARDLALLTDVCSLPTAPFVEHNVIRFVDAFVAARKHLTLQRDSSGNLLITQKSTGPATRGKTSPRLVFAAHMDHPGGVMTAPTFPRGWKAKNGDVLRLAAERGHAVVAFRGGVYAEYLKGAVLEWFDTDGAQAGHKAVAQSKVVDCLTEPGKQVPFGLVVAAETPIPSGAAGMFSVGTARVKGDFVHSRVCDDLAGAASALALIDRPTKSRVPIAVLLTRGEEEGFVGALAAVDDGKLLRKSDRIIAIECSAEQTYAPAGQGVVLRCGDRTSIFHSGLTYFMNSLAGEVAKSTQGFAFQRALMPGGTCESTVYDAWGYVSAAVCVPLRNYHNMDKAAGRLAAEAIHTGDWACMVRLFRELAAKAHLFAEGHPEIRQRLSKILGAKRRLLKR